jgi:hypothetical protein
VTLHGTRGARVSLWVDDGYGNLTRITFLQIQCRIATGWGDF